ncbi:MAG: hypothetical protein EAZ81_01365 [Verrucomicrobia bacterium]|nr:MAG: hypothetical protein EAZ81_01365 [Verrucomicrobiota bacterium]
MKCPQCEKWLLDQADECPHCGYFYRASSSELMAHPPSYSILTDQAGLLRFKERKQVKRLLEAFMQRFPGRFLAVMSIAPSPHEQAALAGLSLFNRCHFTEAGELASAAGMILLIDIEKKHALMVYGYLWEEHWTEEDSQFCLAKGQTHWSEGLYLAGVIATIAAIEKILVRRHRRLHQTSWFDWRPKKLPRCVAASSKRGGSS